MKFSDPAVGFVASESRCDGIGDEESIGSRCPRFLWLIRPQVLIHGD